MCMQHQLPNNISVAASFSQECDSPISSPFWATRPFGRREAGERGGVGTRAESALFQPWDPGINPPPRYNPIQLGAAPRLTEQRTQREGQHVSQGRHRHVHTPPRNERQRGRCHLWPCTSSHQPPSPINTHSPTNKPAPSYIQLPSQPEREKTPNVASQ